MIFLPLAVAPIVLGGVLSIGLLKYRSKKFKTKGHPWVDFSANEGDTLKTE